MVGNICFVHAPAVFDYLVLDDVEGRSGAGNQGTAFLRSAADGQEIISGRGDFGKVFQRSELFQVIHVDRTALVVLYLNRQKIGSE